MTPADPPGEVRRARVVVTTRYNAVCWCGWVQTNHLTSENAEHDLDRHLNEWHDGAQSGPSPSGEIERPESTT